MRMGIEWHGRKDISVIGCEVMNTACSFRRTLNYIRQNPVSAGLCARAGERPWIFDPSAASAEFGPTPPRSAA